MGRSATFVAALAVAAVTTAARPAADESVPTRVVAEETSAGLQVKVLEGPFGRLIDVNLTDEAPAEIDLELLVGQSEVNDQVQLSPPFVEAVYAFTGIDQTAVCSMKLQLDAFLALSGRPNVAYSDQPNELCEDLGVSPIAAWRTDYVLSKGYRRVLILHVSETGDVPFPYAEDPSVWAHMNLPAGLFEDEKRLLQEVTAFTEANSYGLWALAPLEVAPLSEPLTVSFLAEGTPLWSLELGVASPPGWLWPSTSDAVARIILLCLALFEAVVLGLVVALWWLFIRPRRQVSADALGKPLRAITVGYGANRSYSLGGGEKRDVALVVLYDGGRMRIVRKSPGERITVNGEDVKDGAWITGSDKVAIGPKFFQFT